ncbi:DUF4244 domain-containing protein [Cellulomonas fimi]|uniref:DUF4244 domain-containing protein n=1 Tax=Cellulomonas fimi TaxID=1708 RepID=UPI00234C7D0B|nr:DUF4244 domain-containing protein [Cellulomonas fimi]MDC7123487.1 DUF4244 domain-containing protein [Cellulomonas fimi]
MRRTDDEFTTQKAGSSDATARVPDPSPDGRVRGRRLPSKARGGRGVRACGRLGTTVAQRARAVGVDAGMATAEYAIVTLAAVGFAGLLVVILKSGEVKGLLTGIVRQALSL